MTPDTCTTDRAPMTRPDLHTMSAEQLELNVTRCCRAMEAIDYHRFDPTISPHVAYLYAPGTQGARFQARYEMYDQEWQRRYAIESAGGTH